MTYDKRLKVFANSALKKGKIFPADFIKPGTSDLYEPKTYFCISCIIRD